jgi:Ca2+-binding RTX toxin-like protein
MSAANAVLASATGTFQTRIDGFDILSVAPMGASSIINLANLDSINAVESAGGAFTMTLNGAQDGFILAQTANATGHTINLATDSGTDDMTYIVTGSTGIAAGILTADLFETINIVSDDSATTPTGITHTLTVSSSKATTLDISGDAGLTLTDSSTILTLVDASDATGPVSWATIGGLDSAATILGGAGADNFGGSANTATANLSMNGGLGQDTLVGGQGNDSITDTSVETNGNGNNLSGADGNDTITAGDGNDTLSGGNGNDSIVAGGGADAITDGAGNDRVLAGQGADTITAGTGNDYFDGNAGNDLFVMGQGNWTSLDTIDGGEGDNSLTVTLNATGGQVDTTTAGTTTNVQTITATFDDTTALDVLALANVIGLNYVEPWVWYRWCDSHSNRAQQWGHRRQWRHRCCCCEH